jgi:MFS family permease
MVFIDMSNGVVRTLVSGAGFFGDQYANNMIGRMSDIWKTEYDDFTHDDNTMVKMVFYVGAIIGMLTFGFVADLIGRKWAFVTTVSITALTMFLSAACQPGGDFSLYAQISLLRFFTGIGIGGEYPLVAAVAGESVSAKARAKAILHCFAMQGWGNFFANLIPFICISAGASYEFTWRFSTYSTLSAPPFLRVVQPSATNLSNHCPNPYDRIRNTTHSNLSFPQVLLSVVSFPSLCSRSAR